MNQKLCGWCITNLVRPSFIADRAADCPGCAEHRAYKEATATATDCQENPYHLCDAGKPCTCICHNARNGHLPRPAATPKPKPRITLRKRKPNARKDAHS